jgi:NAD(P)-dependent dehydrogenase (short-subunit alcohol dehydrogenase family)
MASLAAFNGKHDRVAYCTSKGAVLNMTRAKALDLARHGIRVNGVARGIINTEIQARNSPHYLQAQAERAAIGCNGTPDGVANAVQFLLRELASFISGETIVVDGGLTARYV